MSTDDAMRLIERVAKLEAESRQEDQAHEQTISQRDAAEEALSNAYLGVTGHEAIWSNLFGYNEALDDICSETHGLRERIAKLTAEVAQLHTQLIEVTDHRCTLVAENKRLKAPVVSGIVFTYDEIDELCCEWGEPQYLRTDDGEAWYWKFEGSDLPVADNLAELLLAARQLIASRATRTPPQEGQ